MQSMLAAAVENSGDDSVESGKGRQRSQILECLSLSGQLPFLPKNLSSFYNFWVPL